MIEIINILHRK